MTDTITQTDKIKATLINREKLTSVVAFEKYFITRLSAIIMRLRKQGWPIITIRAKKNGLASYTLPKSWKPDR